MATRLFRVCVPDFSIFSKQQIRHGHKMRGKPPTEARTLQQRLEEINRKDPELSFQVNIGFNVPKCSRREMMNTLAAEMKIRRADPNLERASRRKELLVDIKKAREEWIQTSAPDQIKKIAAHYGIYNNLFGEAYFKPILPMNIEYDIKAEDMVAKVYTGNLLKPKETENPPTVKYNANSNTLWTLLMTTPDGSMVNSNNEYCHWFIPNVVCYSGNIPGNEIAKGEQLIDYLRPIPAQGLGYCRYIFILYKQNQRIDYSCYKKAQPCLSLVERDWNTLDFYRKYQELITPAGLAFFQADWDESLTKFYHQTLQMKEPKFEYDFPQPYIKPQVWFPIREPFNLYLDKYRDPKDINKEFLLRKLKKIHPFKPPEPPLKYPNAHPYPKDTPSWLALEMKKERLGWGRVNNIE